MSKIKSTLSINSVKKSSKRDKKMLYKKPWKKNNVNKKICNKGGRN